MLTSVWKAIHTIVKHFVDLGYLKWLFPWFPNFCFSLNVYKLLRRGGWLLAAAASLKEWEQSLKSLELENIRPGFIFSYQSSKSSAAVLVPTFFICFYIFNIAEKHVNWINAGWFAVLHCLSWVFFLCALTRFDIQLMFLLERKLICGCLNGLNIKMSPWHGRVSSPQGRKSVIPPAWGRWVMQGYENFWLFPSDHHPALASTPGGWKPLLFMLQM